MSAHCCIKLDLFINITKYYLGAQILVDEMGGGCGTYAGEEVLAEF